MSARRPKLLIVDDEVHVRESLSSWFTDDGYEVTTAPGGKEALALLGREHFDIMISDIKMPGMDGLELQRRVRRVDADLVIILVTAYASVATAVQGLKEGAYDYLVKPFDPADMSRVVEKACEKIRLEEENLALRRRLEEREGPEFVTGVSQRCAG
ncbi:MAG: response regulator [Acidobacteriota bacterium]|nr:response regulator [Acidobacteriota bacterium]